MMRSLPADFSRVAGRPLRWILLGLDVAAIFVAWFFTLIAPGQFASSLRGSPSRFLVELTVITVASVLVIGSQRLYQARVCGVRAVETARLARASALAGLTALLTAGALATTLSPLRAAVGSVAMFVLLELARALYVSWLRRARTQGRFCRPIVLVGTGPEAVSLQQLIDHHPELGFRVTGVAGPSAVQEAQRLGVAAHGGLDDVVGVLERAGANGVLIATSDLASDDLNGLTRDLLRHDVHVHFSSGLRGIDHRRIRSLPLAHEPLYYLESRSLAPWQRSAKRALDVLVASVMLVVTSPVLLVSMIAIKLHDRGPVFYRQTRVGRGGASFELLKLRTMVPRADERVGEFTGDNERTGPLFKVRRDPRRTPVGHRLERASIDELPQLINVLRGEMSLVGPRPALQAEVEQFDEELRGREDVPPGITGLWQVEARDNPEFGVYRRLDLFYVENWSVGLDLAIMAETGVSILERILHPRARATIVAPIEGATDDDPEIIIDLESETVTPANTRPASGPGPLTIGSNFEQVLSAARDGSELAVIALYRSVNPRLLRYLGARSPLFADDIAAETWLVVTPRLETFHGNEQDFRAWLFQVARQRLTEYVKRPTSTPRARTTIDLTAAPAHQAAATISATLPPDEAEVVLLRVVGGLDADQVAVILGRPLHTVRELEQRGVAQLAGRLNIEALAP
ncbi:MAG: sugar transferase [Actinomycetia bacterium]|nr:sugar transferase [Actinomycetes bacterium]